METQKIRVLLVEDDFSIVRNLSSMLEQEGFAVDVAMGQAQALQLFEQRNSICCCWIFRCPTATGTRFVRRCASCRKYR